MFRVGRDSFRRSLRSLTRIRGADIGREVLAGLQPVITAADAAILPYDQLQSYFTVNGSILGTNGGEGVWWGLQADAQKQNDTKGAATVDRIRVFVEENSPEYNVTVRVGQRNAGTAFGVPAIARRAILRNQPVGRVGYLDGATQNDVAVLMQVWLNQGATVPTILDSFYERQAKPVAPGGRTYDITGLPITLAGNSALYVWVRRIQGVEPIKAVVSFDGRLDLEAEPQTA